MSNAADAAHQLAKTFGLSGMELRHGLSQDELFHQAILNDRGRVEPDGPDDAQKAYSTSLGVDGPLVYFTDPSCTGRPVQDTFCVDRAGISDDIWWKRGFARFDPAKFDDLLPRVIDHLNERAGHLYVTDVFCGWDPDFAEPYRFVGEYATHAYFCNIMFPRDVRDDADRATEGWTLINVPSFTCDPDRDGTISGRGVIIDIENRVGLVLGRADYCGVNKKTMFTIMNFVLPSKGQLSMHCSANVGETWRQRHPLRALGYRARRRSRPIPNRELIGDDEHVWTDRGVSNFEDGCYAKLIDLDKSAEPVIAAAMSMRGTLVENVPPLPGKRGRVRQIPRSSISPTGRSPRTPGLRTPSTANPNVRGGCGRGPHPETIVLLTADAFGVLASGIDSRRPMRSMYHFAMGFTSKLAGTEVGVTEPEAFVLRRVSAPLSWPTRPTVYSELLAKRGWPSTTPAASCSTQAGAAAPTARATACRSGPPGHSSTPRSRVASTMSSSWCSRSSE